MNGSDKDVKSAKNELASTDRNGGNRTTQRHIGPMPMQAWDDIIGQRISQAMNDGEFDNLPGKGKPQNLEQNPFAGDNHLAFDIMASNDIAPGWITRRKEIQERVEKLRADMQSEAALYRHNLTLAAASIGVDAADMELAKRKVSALWTQRSDMWGEEIAAINRLIQSINLEQPLPEMEMCTLRLSEELMKAGAG